ncbi:MAG: type II restriction endonuclease [Firmicutes bacterium]|nr:type II restriction endonuclease [Bacillota bacterium]
MIDKKLLGSSTAKGGFANEKDVCQRFENWVTDIVAQEWLQIMGYDLNEIESVHCIILHGYKADINIQVRIKLKQAVDVQNLSIKLVSNKKGFNQIDKRPVDVYNTKLGWNMPLGVVGVLKRFTGECVPNIESLRNAKRMFIDEFESDELNQLFAWITKNKTMILIDILRGRGEFCAEWMLVAQKTQGVARWVLKNINQVINFYDGEVCMSKKGSILLGKILVQRKGGTPDPMSLQFKFDPSLLFAMG